MRTRLVNALALLTLCGALGCSQLRHLRTHVDRVTQIPQVPYADGRVLLFQGLPGTDTVCVGHDTYRHTQAWTCTPLWRVRTFIAQQGERDSN